MGDPYTSVTVTNYNANPPADDGSQVDSNEITWAKHKTKLSDPLKTAIESIDTNVGAAVDKLGVNTDSKSDDYTILAADQGKALVQTGASKTFTTPAAATVGEPFWFYVLNQSSDESDLTVDGNASETIDGATTITVPYGRGCLIYTDGTNWQTAGQNWPEAIIPRDAFVIPKGRLTLTSGVPVLTSSTTAQTTVYYTPYNGNVVMLYDGTNWKGYAFSELSQALSDATKSPLASAADTNYDMFVWDDSGTLRCTRGPAWDSDTSRGSGNDLSRTDGVLMNASNITNGPNASRGLYVGTIRTNSSNQVDFMIGAPSPAAGGTNNRLYLWNMYNRVDVAALSRDSTNSWTYTTATWRAANNNNSNRVTMVRGQDEDLVGARFSALFSNSNNGTMISSGVGVDSTSAFSGTPSVSPAEGTTGNIHSIDARYEGLPGVGLHYLQALEHSEASGTTTWYGDNGDATTFQMGLHVRTLM